MTGTGIDDDALVKVVLGTVSAFVAAFVAVICVFVMLIYCIFKRKFDVNDTDNTKSRRKSTYGINRDMNHAFVCRHVGCNKAPSPSAAATYSADYRL